MVCYVGDERAHTRHVDDGDSCSQSAGTYGGFLTYDSAVEHRYNGF
jgi:hypothetical protein